MSAVATFPPPSLGAQLAELKREKAMRARVYPHWIATKKMTQDKADHNNRGLDGAIASLEALALAHDDSSAADILKDAGERFAKRPPT
jgi:hypothetical protein